jgi:antitoxin CptB
MLSADRRRRLRWRARRGLLENDILLTRFLDAHEQGLSEQDVESLDQLLDLPDNELLDLFLARTELEAPMNTDAMQTVLARVRLS